MTRKRFHIILIPHADAAIRNIRLPYSLLTILLVLGLASVGVLGFLVYHYLNFTIDSIARLELRSANSAMAERLQSIDKELLDIKGEMKQLVDLDEKMRLLAGMDQLDPDVRRVGVGGPVAEIDPILENLPADTRYLVEKVSLGTDELLRQTRFQMRSFIEINETIQENEEEMAHTPTIAPVEFPPPGSRWSNIYDGYLASGFGLRPDPFTGRQGFHEGIDISARAGTPIRAPADGKVYFRYADSHPGNAYLGKIIRIDHGNGIRTLYGHMSNYNVQMNQQVKRGDIIGYVGDTGKATGTHLHYGVFKNNKRENPLKYILPQAYLLALGPNIR
ncbi:M23 family metallopeptidase [candidate division KSB1 bacterium]